MADLKGRLKQAGKTVANMFGNTFVGKKVKKIGIIVLIIALVIIIIAASTDYLDVINGLLPGSADDPNYNEYCPLAYFNNIYVADDGSLMAATSVEDMWKHDKRYSQYLSSEDALAYLLNAQVVSQYPYIESADNDQLNGTVKFYRNSSEIPMKYVSKDTMEGYISSYNSSRK